jgi:predicted O-methyltransferase YrrM
MLSKLHALKYFIRHFFLANRKGHGVHSPFAYRLCEEVFYSKDSFYDFEQLNQIRRALLSDQSLMETGQFGAGSITFRSSKRKVSDIAKLGISSITQSEIFYRLINYLQLNQRVELGTSLGLNTLYLALANTKGSTISIEGSHQLHAYAKTLAKKNNICNIRHLLGEFDEVLPLILKENEALDFLYIDGNHTFEATLNYFKMALAKKHENSLFILDDIYWSSGMTKAWQIIQKHPEVKLAIDCYYFGLIFFKEAFKEKQLLKFYI